MSGLIWPSGLEGETALGLSSEGAGSSVGGSLRVFLSPRASEGLRPPRMGVALCLREMMGCPPPLPDSLQAWSTGERERESGLDEEGERASPRLEVSGVLRLSTEV